MFLLLISIVSIQLLTKENPEKKREDDSYDQMRNKIDCALVRTFLRGISIGYTAVMSRVA